MHFFSAYLHLQYLAFGTDHSRVQGAVAVFLGAGYIVVELVGYVAPHTMNHPQCLVAGGHILHQNPHRPDVMYLGKANPLALHFSPDAVDVFGTSGYFEFETCLIKGI